MTQKDYPRLIISAGILILFAVAYVLHSDNALLIGALISMASTAVTYWLGSSKGSADKSDELARQSGQVDQANIEAETVNIEERR